jgi:hypothetical protein
MNKNLWFTPAEVTDFFETDKKLNRLDLLRLEQDWIDMEKYMRSLEEQLEIEKAANDLLSRLDVNVENKRLKEERDSLAKLASNNREEYNILSIEMSALKNKILRLLMRKRKEKNNQNVSFQ